MVLVKEYTNRAMGQNREPRNKPTQIQSTDLWQKSKGDTMEQRESFQQMLLEQLDIHTHKKWI